MTGLFAGLVQRGAGIRPSAGAPLLVPRRRSRFEPIPGLPDSAGDALVEDTTPAAPSIVARPPDETASRRSMERSETPGGAEPAIGTTTDFDDRAGRDTDRSAAARRCVRRAASSLRTGPSARHPGARGIDPAAGAVCRGRGEAN
jgi:hypothetical protein